VVDYTIEHFQWCGANPAVQLWDRLSQWLVLDVFILDLLTAVTRQLIYVLWCVEMTTSRNCGVVQQGTSSSASSPSSHSSVSFLCSHNLLFVELVIFSATAD